MSFLVCTGSNCPVCHPWTNTKAIHRMALLCLVCFFFFLVSFLWFWVSLSSVLLLSPLLEPSLLFFLLSVRSLLGAVAVTPPKKKQILPEVCLFAGKGREGMSHTRSVGCCGNVVVFGLWQMQQSEYFD